MYVEYVYIVFNIFFFQKNYQICWFYNFQYLIGPYIRIYILAFVFLYINKLTKYHELKFFLIVNDISNSKYSNCWPVIIKETFFFIACVKYTTYCFQQKITINPACHIIYNNFLKCKYTCPDFLSYQETFDYIHAYLHV